jgi:hypothetical protein
MTNYPLPSATDRAEIFAVVDHPNGHHVRLDNGRAARVNASFGELTTQLGRTAPFRLTDPWLRVLNSEMTGLLSANGGRR